MDAKDASQPRREVDRARPPSREIEALVVECEALLQRQPLPALGRDGDAFVRLLALLERRLAHDWG